MGFFTSLAKSKLTRKGTTASAEASAHVPSGNSAFGDNSRGASKASAEVTDLLTSCFDDFDSDDELMSNIEHVHRRLNERASQYSNAGLPEGSGVEWKPNKNILNLVRVAIECSVNVYFPSSPPPYKPGLAFEELKEISPSLNGVTKATKFFKVSSVLGTHDSNFPLMAIAVRGTEAKSLDWLVNFNHEARDASSFLDFTDVQTHGQLDRFKLEAHGGYLHGAKDLETSVRKEMLKCRSTSIRHVLFTGHSAGGAVSTLLFMHILGVVKREFPEFRFSLITFGCPPIMSQQLTPWLNQLMEKQTSPGVALAIINAHDPISRADNSYAETMTDLYNKPGAAAAGYSDLIQAPWPMKPQDLHPVGELIILKDTSETDMKELHGYKITPHELSQLIFCDRMMHKKAEYLENIKLLQGESEVNVDTEEDLGYLASRIR